MLATIAGPKQLSSHEHETQYGPIRQIRGASNLIASSEIESCDLLTISGSPIVRFLRLADPGPSNPLKAANNSCDRPLIDSQWAHTRIHYVCWPAVCLCHCLCMLSRCRVRGIRTSLTADVWYVLLTAKYAVSLSRRTQSQQVKLLTSRVD